MTAPEKNTTGKPRKPPPDVERLQDKEYSESDFDRALRDVTKRLVDPDRPPARGSTRR